LVSFSIHVELPHGRGERVSAQVGLQAKVLAEGTLIGLAEKSPPQLSDYWNRGLRQFGNVLADWLEHRIILMHQRPVDV
jgi:hypothetical protein